MTPLRLVDEAATVELGERLATCLETPLVVFLQGPIGAGKTTLVRGLLHALGHEGSVKSPTYTLYECYDIAANGRDLVCIHCDLYRLSDPGELQFVALADLQRADTCLLVEWPENAAGALPPPDITIRLDYAGTERQGELTTFSAAGRRVLHDMRQLVDFK